MAEWFDGTMVKMLDGTNFDDREPWKLKDKTCSFVLFFAGWCGHCQTLKPEYIKFADRTCFIKVFAVDSDAEKNLLDKMSKNKKSPVKIVGYPTIWIYVNGKPYKEYSGKNDHKSLLAEAMKVCGKKSKCL